MRFDLDPATCAALGFRPDGLADLSRLGLSPESIEARRHFIGGSDSTIIAHGKPRDVNRLAEIKRGVANSDDLSDEIYVQLGTWTEPFILAWCEKKRGCRITRRGERVFHPRYPFLAATLDGWIEEEDGTRRVVQAKHVNAFANLRDVQDFYTPQLRHEVACTGADGALLVVLKGTLIFKMIEIDVDYEGWAAQLEQERAFWHARLAGYPPRTIPIKPRRNAR